MRLVLLLILASKISVLFAKQGSGVDLPSNDPLRIGIKRRSSSCSAKVKSGDILSVHYVGQFYADNREFDSSRHRDEPMVFVIGKGNVIKGWDQGLIGMCVGEIRKLIVPSDLAYGDTGKGMGMDIGIPERATLVFEVELLNIEDPDYFIKKRGVPL